MDWLNQLISEDTLYYWENFIQNWGMAITVGLLGVELLVLTIKKKFTFQIVGDALANFGTFALFIIISYLVFGLAYLAGLFWIYQNFSISQLPLNGWTVLACIILADMAFYWEHRFVHRCAFGWATHTVHHSSPYFNLSVGYRFGPLDGLMPFFFFAPLAMLGFHPLVIFAAEALIHVYGNLLHTEMVRRLPRPIEFIFNTPSHHRVHHGSNPEYIDKNYAGLFIIWDRIFGTFEEEKAEVKYGITVPVETLNPLKLFFIGFTRLTKQVIATKGLANKIATIVKPPGWSPK
ncbi:MAG: sterol desaturase family protein [Cellvibrionaceae bacterium]|nr:sterol desaturase family protein [Cellvibrionaceae bacterium]